jgi:hypothetical protein
LPCAEQLDFHLVVEAGDTLWTDLGYAWRISGPFPLGRRHRVGERWEREIALVLLCACSDWLSSGKQSLTSLCLSVCVQTESKRVCEGQPLHAEAG